MANQEETLPLFAETVSVSTREIEKGRVRVRVAPQQFQESIPVTLTDRQVLVERVPVGRFVDSAPATRVEGDTTIIPVLEERAVVTVRLFLREEVRVREVRATHAETRDIRLRRETATVERVPSEEGDTSNE